MVSTRYTELAITADLAQSSLEEAVEVLGRHASYVLHVHPTSVDYASKVVPMVRMRPGQISTVPDCELRCFEWFIEAGGVAIGSPGC